nr:MAG TPA: hypothetical protein [Caudoviricetes sp.]
MFNHTSTRHFPPRYIHISSERASRIIPDPLR